MANSSSSFTALTDGTGAVPVYTFINDLTTGLYHPTGGALGFAADGVSRMILDNTTLDSTVTYRAPNGTNSDPSFTFSGDTNTGMYSIGADILGFSVGNDEALRLRKSPLGANAHVEAPGGLTNGPSYSFVGDTDTGMWSSTSGQIDFTTNSSTVFSIDGTAITSTEPFLAPSGSAGAPGYSFSGDLGTGMYQAGAGILSFTADAIYACRMVKNATTNEGQVKFRNGTNANPSITFDGDENTGIFRVGADSIGISTNGVTRMSISGSAVTFVPELRIPTTGATDPGIGFSGDDHTGMYWVKADTVGLTAGGTSQMELGTSGHELQQYFGQQTLTDAASIAWNLATQQSAIVTLAGNRTLAAPTNQKAGATYCLIVKQDGTGTRTLAYNAVYKFPGGTAPTLSTAGGSVDILTFISDGTNMYGNAALDFQ